MEDTREKSSEPYFPIGASESCRTSYVHGGDVYCLVRNNIKCKDVSPRICIYKEEYEKANR